MPARPPPMLNVPQQRCPAGQSSLPSHVVLTATVQEFAAPLAPEAPAVLEPPLDDVCPPVLLLPPAPASCAAGSDDVSLEHPLNTPTHATIDVTPVNNQGRVFMFMPPSCRAGAYSNSGVRKNRRARLWGSKPSTA